MFKFYLSKVIQIHSLIFICMSFYKKNEQLKGKASNLNRFQVLWTFHPLQSKETFAQKVSSSQIQPYVNKVHTLKVQVLEPFQISKLFSFFK